MKNISEVLSKAAELVPSGKISTFQGETPSVDAEHKNLDSPIRCVPEFPRTLDEGCVAVPFALTACIPKSAIRKFAAGESFVVHVNDLGVESTVCFFGESHSTS